MCSIYLKYIPFLQNFITSYVPTLSFWVGGSRFQGAAPVLPYITEISRFWNDFEISDIYEFFKLITLFRNWM